MPPQAHPWANLMEVISQLRIPFPSVSSWQEPTSAQDNTDVWRGKWKFKQLVKHQWSLTYLSFAQVAFSSFTLFKIPNQEGLLPQWVNFSMSVNIKIIPHKRAQGPTILESTSIEAFFPGDAGMSK